MILLHMNLAKYLFNDDLEGFERECQRLFGKKKNASSDEAANINKDNNRYSRTSKADEEIEL